MSRVLVTGGAGAIGSHLTARLLDDGHDVTVLDDLSSGRESLVPDGAQLIVGSVTDDEDLEKAFARRPERVAHLAALFANQNSVDHPEQDLVVNGLGTLKVLLRSSADAVQKVLLCSSSCVYPSADVLDEREQSRAHTTPYAITKGLGEDYGRYFAAHAGLDVVIVRPFNVYGPHEYPGAYRNVIPNFLLASMRGEPLTITGTGVEQRDFNYVVDVARGMSSALFGDTEPGAVYNLASGVEVRIAQLAAAVNALTGSTAGIRYVPRRSWDATPRRQASTERASSAFGYRATVGLEEGLEATLAWLRQVCA